MPGSTLSQSDIDALNAAAGQSMPEDMPSDAWIDYLKALAEYIKSHPG